MKRITSVTVGLFTVLTFFGFFGYHHSMGGTTTINSESVKVISNNNATVTNYSTAVAISGKSIQIGGEDGNTMTTGAAMAGTTTTNMVNTNTITIGQI